MLFRQDPFDNSAVALKGYLYKYALLLLLLLLMVIGLSGVQFGL